MFIDWFQNVVSPVPTINVVLTTGVDSPTKAKLQEALRAAKKVSRGQLPSPPPPPHIL